MTEFIVVMITSPEGEEARAIARALLEKRLAACVGIYPKGESLFRWEGKIDRAEEHLLIAKTRKELLEPLIATVQSIHSYEVPEIVALPIAGGSKEYLDWLDSEVSP
ncbi:MAG: divalent-cation tolerance protein CutA [Candidatus Erginobacter occultus]|nr:divalent-cation tolerance protein CutA [Candidatus Erginobacter occultus]